MSASIVQALVFIISAVLVLIGVYVLGYVVGRAVSEAFFERKRRYNRDLLEELKKRDQSDE